METKPLIKPQGQASKYVEIEILDTLKKNTTYTINFGRSIVDNNEGNALPFFKYVFSTGNYIDSLSVSGTVTDAFKRETDENVSVMLYRLDSTYSDSVVYKTPPTYIAYTQDSTNTFTIENMKEGDYKMVAMKDNNQNYLFEPKRDKIGFLPDTIHLPTDKHFDLTVFKEIPKFEAIRPKQVSKQHLAFGFEGKIDSTKIRLLSTKPEGYRASYFKRPEHDTLDYWFKPYVEADSLLFEVKHKTIRDTLVTVLREMDTDSLKISVKPGSSLPLDGDFELSANTPLTKIETSLISIRNKDSLIVPYKVRFDSFQNNYIFDFEKEEEQTYAIQALPGAITDFFDDKNDTLSYKLRTKSLSDFGTLKLTVENIASFPVIVQLTTEKGEIVKEIIHHKKDGNSFNFQFIPPDSYYVRIIYDDNDNGVWDTGSYLKKRQPEKVIYMRKPIEVRKNWDVSQPFVLK